MIIRQVRRLTNALTAGFAVAVGMWAGALAGIEWVTR